MNHSTSVWPDPSPAPPRRHCATTCAASSRHAHPHRRGSRLRLNLSGCTSINVDGMLALSVAQQAARSRGGDLHLVDVPLPIERQLRQHNFDDLLSSRRPTSTETAMHHSAPAPARVTVRLRRTTPWARARTGARARRPRTVGWWELARRGDQQPDDPEQRNGVPTHASPV